MPERATRLAVIGLPALDREYDVVVRERGQLSAEAKKFRGNQEALLRQLRRELNDQRLIARRLRG